MLAVAVAAVTSTGGLTPAAAREQMAEHTRAAAVRYGEVHDCVLGLIARQAPVAGDLRLALALLHVNDRVERVGAQCRNLLTLRLALREGERLPDAPLRCVSDMATLAGEQLRDAGAAFAARDVQASRRLQVRDSRIDAHNRRCFELAVRAAGQAGEREAALIVVLMARALERVGDNAVDIAQQVQFAVEGRLRVPSLATVAES